METVSNNRKTVHLVTQASYNFNEERKKERKRGEREKEKERKRNAVLSVVVNRTFEKIASIRRTTPSKGTSNGREGIRWVAKWAGKERV